MPNDVAVGIQNADGWDCGVRQPFLTPRFPQERARTEHRRRGRTLVVQDRRHEQGSLASPSRTSTRIATRFEAAKLIHTSRGQIQILDREGLKKEACSCYEYIARYVDRLLPGS
jgi:hypothetical protein